MKKIFILSLMIILITGCSKSPKDDGKFVVYTSFSGMSEFTRMIAGDKAEIKTLIPPGVEAHDWEPGTNDMISLNEADVFIYSGMDMEPWADDVLSGVDNKDLVVVKASEGVTELKSENATDPHVWLNPENALKQMTNIANALSSADSENAEYYMKNLEDVKQKISELDKEYKTVTENLENREIIVIHGAFGYLCDAYGLTQHTLEGLTGESDPSSAAMKDIVDYINKKDNKTLFYIPSEGDKLAKVISSETGAELYALNPFESSTDGKDYFEIMYDNLQNIKDALK